MKEAVSELSVKRQIEKYNQSVVRSFDTGATRGVESSKLDFEGFLSPLVVEAFGTFMHYNRHLPDGSYRASDNWQKGIPKNSYMKSGWRHFLDWWKAHRGLSINENIVWAICGVIFNSQGYLHELLKAHPNLLQESLKHMEFKRNEH